MIIVVNDANVLIDLVKLQLLPYFFSLQIKEIQKPKQCCEGKEKHKINQKAFVDLINFHFFQ